MSRIRNIIALLRGQLWIVPALITGLAGVVAVVLLRYGGTWLAAGDQDAWWLYSGDAQTARGLLSSLLSGMITMTSLVVSVTFVILTLAANQLGPRLITIFMADRQIQLVLGLFLGTILYVIVIFRSLNDTLGAGGVPHLAVTVASGLTVLCLFALLFYVHKIAQSIIADNVVAAVARGLEQDLKTILSDNEVPGSDRAELDLKSSSPDPKHAHVVSLGRDGYVQVVDYGKLVALACREDVMLTVRVRAGHFVLKGGEHVLAHAHDLDRKAEDAVREAFVVGTARTPAQDVEYGIRQLVEIALRALSPGINDPFTALAVIDRLAAVLGAIMVVPLQPKALVDEKGVVRVLADRSDVMGLLDAALDPIRQAGAGHPAILIHMADALGQLAPVLSRPAAREAVLTHLGKLADTARRAPLSDSDKADTLERIAAARVAVLARWTAAPSTHRSCTGQSEPR